MQQLRAVEIGKMRQLADFLETVPPEDFDLGRWRERAPIDAIRIGPITLRKGCGFAGCAMGWAAHSGIFPGLRLSPKGTLTYRGATEFEAVAKLLSLTPWTAYFLFHKDSYQQHADPAHVADRVRRFAAIVERTLNRTGARLRVVAA